MNPLNQKDFAAFLNVSDRTLRRYRVQLLSDFSFDGTLTEGKGNQLMFDPECFETYQQIRDGLNPSSALPAIETIPEKLSPSGSYLPVGGLALNSDSTPVKGDSGSQSDVNQDLAQIEFNGDNLKNFRSFLEMTNKAMTKYQNGLIDGTEEINSQVTEANEMLIETRAIYNRTKEVEIITKVKREGLNTEMGKTAANVIDFSQRLKQRSQ